MKHVRAARSLVRLVLLAVGVLLAVPVTTAEAAASVEGDEAGFRQLLEALRANATQFPHGRIEFRCTWMVLPKESQLPESSSGEGTLVWSGDRERWEVAHSRAGRVLPQNAPRTLILLSGDNSFSYVPPSGTRTNAVSKIEVGYPIHAHPMFEYVSPARWGNLERGHQPWADRIDPERSGAESIEVLRKVDDLHVLLRFPSRPNAAVIGSFAQGGNITSYDWPGITGLPPGRVSYSRRGSSEWAKTPDGRWFPKQTSFARFMADRPQQAVLEVSCEVTAFDGTEPDESLFDFRSVTVAPGTHVSATARDRQRRSLRLGNETDAERRAALVTLARDVGAEAFAGAAE